MADLIKQTERELLSELREAWRAYCSCSPRDGEKNAAWVLDIVRRLAERPAPISDYR